DVMKTPFPRIINREGSAETHTAEDAQQVAARQRQVYQRKEVFIPTNRDAIFGDATETFKNPFIERPIDFGPGVNRTRRFIAIADECLLERLDLQAIHTGHAKTFIDEVVRQGISRRPHADDEHILAVIWKRV